MKLRPNFSKKGVALIAAGLGMLIAPLRVMRESGTPDFALIAFPVFFVLSALLIVVGLLLLIGVFSEDEVDSSTFDGTRPLDGLEKEKHTDCKSKEKTEQDAAANP